MDKSANGKLNYDHKGVELVSMPILNHTKDGSSLISKNVTICGSRTSIRLEPEMWEALQDISLREGCSIHDVCSIVSLFKNKKSSLTSSVRVFMMLYYKAATTEEGHKNAHHGDQSTMREYVRRLS